MRYLRQRVIERIFGGAPYGVTWEEMGLNYDLVKPEYTYGDSRTDFYMESNGEKFLTEVKGCTLADDLHLGTGLFPDAPTERGVKHLYELTKAAKEGYHCSIAFVIQMNGIHRVLPNEATQPEFKDALVKAAKAGVQIVCYSCHVEADSIKITGVVGDALRFANIRCSAVTVRSIMGRRHNRLDIYAPAGAVTLCVAEEPEMYGSY